jgi:hypothetical protein
VTGNSLAFVTSSLAEIIIVSQLVLTVRRAVPITRHGPALYLIAFMCGIVAMLGAVLHPATRAATPAARLLSVICDR